MTTPPAAGASEPIPEFPFPIHAVRGGELASQLQKLRSEYAATGHIPVILGDRDSVERLMETYEFNTEEGELPDSLERDPSAWFQERIDEDPEAFESMEDDEFHPESAAPMTSFAAGHDHRGNEIEEVWIAKVEAAHSWDLPLKLGYGAWNSCPSPEGHSVIARYWAEKYGAEIAVMTSDTVEFTVARPPVTPEQCAELAREQFIYCTDIVDQGVGSVSTLAKCLEGSTVWFFWWD
ncbi:DUF4253 domain-containing protein [Luteolibacter sp. Populi]|uniref:DUF4253 domain-containing protein n=1 Tax=Luteolibacter sp. Populi TaxID=3230487 RepID=UPI0034655CEB